MFQKRTAIRGVESLASDLAYAIKAHRRAYLRSMTSDTAICAEKEVTRCFNELSKRIGHDRAEAVQIGIEAALAM